MIAVILVLTVQRVIATSVCRLHVAPTRLFTFVPAARCVAAISGDQCDDDHNPCDHTDQDADH